MKAASRTRTLRFDFRRRSSGLLLHVTSLPGPHGSGDLGSEAHRFVDFLADAGQTWWQMLPVGPPGRAPAFSPYDSTSAFAGSPWLVSLEALSRQGLLVKRDLPSDSRVEAPCRRQLERVPSETGNSIASRVAVVV